MDPDYIGYFKALETCIAVEKKKKKSQNLFSSMYISADSYVILGRF